VTPGELVWAVGQALTGRFRPPSASLSAQQNVEALIEATGSGRAAARTLGVAESTLRGWRHGVKPRGGNQPLVVAARAALTAKTGELARARAGQTELAITGIIVVSSDSRKRTVHPGRYIPRSTINRILTMWSQAQPDDKVEAALLRAIDRWYQPLDFDQVIGAAFE
jgi:transposase-like protein